MAITIIESELSFVKPCECGCGKPVNRHPKTGKPYRYVAGHNIRVSHPLKRRPFAERFWDKVDKTSGQGPNGDCWEWRGCRHEDGYGAFRNGHTRSTSPAHRIAYELAIGPIPKGLIIRHTCDNPPCCNPSHLIPGTTRENAQDAQARKRLRKYSGITVDDVRTMREMYASGNYTRREILRRYPISASTLRDILIRHTWKHVE